MGKGGWIGSSVVILGLLLSGCYQSMGGERGVSRITKEELKAMLGKPDVIVVDVRQSWDWNKSQEKIPGAVREDPEKDVKTWATKYPKDKTLVFYCA